MVLKLKNLGLITIIQGGNKCQTGSRHLPVERGVCGVEPLKIPGWEVCGQGGGPPIPKCRRRGFGEEGGSPPLHKFPAPPGPDKQAPGNRPSRSSPPMIVTRPRVPKQS